MRSRDSAVRVQKVVNCAPSVQVTVTTKGVAYALLLRGPKLIPVIKTNSYRHAEVLYRRRDRDVYTEDVITGDAYLELA